MTCTRQSHPVKTAFTNTETGCVAPSFRSAAQSQTHSPAAPLFRRSPSRGHRSRLDPIGRLYLPLTTTSSSRVWRRADGFSGRVLISCRSVAPYAVKRHSIATRFTAMTAIRAFTREKRMAELMRGATGGATAVPTHDPRQIRGWARWQSREAAAG